MKKTMNIQFDSYDMVERFSKEIANVKGEFDLSWESSVWIFPSP